ncbi:MAG: adenylate/guanylate cyclase domain-containing protein [Pseudomonadota bacterium]
MSRVDCISNRNIQIIATYVENRLGHRETLFDELPYPADRYSSAEGFFFNEDEWTTFENFQRILRKAQEMVGERYFYFNCGASAAYLRSWGRLEYFSRVFASPDDGYKRLPFFTQNFTDTKEIEVVIPPAYDRATGKIRTVLKIRYNDDIDVNKDYTGDRFTRGIISSIPTIWGLSPATVKQPLNPYDPEVLFNEDPEFTPLGLEVRMEGDHLTLRDPGDGKHRPVGRKVLLEPDTVSGKEVFLGKYNDLPGEGRHKNERGHGEAILITETVQWDGGILLKAGEIFKAPYFIQHVTYDRLSLLDRLNQAFRFRRIPEDSGKGMIETINRLRELIESRNEAYYALEKANQELKEAKGQLEDYSRNLEVKVEERTAELNKAREELLVFNRDLKAKVKEQVGALKRYDELRRYLSPKIAEKILSSGDMLWGGPQRKMMTVLFSDIRNFSALTDSLEPEEIFHLMDRYLSEMTALIHRYDGTLNKIIGDGMLVFYGDPLPMEDHAQKAVLTAVEMQKKTAELSEEWLQYGYELKIGVGINAGYMTVGNIGSDIHKDYTVIGNQVNVAARLVSLAKPGQILISQRTLSRVKDLVEVEKVGEIQVKGIYQPVITYNVKV